MRQASPAMPPPRINTRGRSVMCVGAPVPAAPAPRRARGTPRHTGSATRPHPAGPASTAPRRTGRGRARHAARTAAHLAHVPAATLGAGVAATPLRSRPAPVPAGASARLRRSTAGLLDELPGRGEPGQRSGVLAHRRPVSAAAVRAYERKERPPHSAQMGAFRSTVSAASARRLVRYCARARWISPTISQTAKPCWRPMSRTSAARRAAVWGWPPRAAIQPR